MLYFGDLDPTGVWIPQQASTWMQRHNLPLIQADLQGYAWLLTLGAGKEVSRKEGSEDIQAVNLSWLGPYAEQAEALFAKSKRLPQEFVTWDFLRKQPASAVG